VAEKKEAERHRVEADVFDSLRLTQPQKRFTKSAKKGKKRIWKKMMRHRRPMEISAKDKVGHCRGVSGGIKIPAGPILTPKAEIY
jgi:hypothetical protein